MGIPVQRWQVMTPDRRQQIEKLYHSALQQDASRRAAFPNQACTGDADALILPLNLEFPEVQGVTDHQPEQMATTRRRLLNQAAKGKATASTSHFPFPGLGHVAPKGNVWEWPPISASSDAHG
jgi:hypothetical protein